MSVDGFVAGPRQTLANPIGEGGMVLHDWHFNPQGEDQMVIDEWQQTPGAYVMGRNMFGPGRGEWDLDWKGWWGDEPPYHAPVFVLTHHPREPLAMAGGTTFHFVTDGRDTALEQAMHAAGGKNPNQHVAGPDFGYLGVHQPQHVRRAEPLLHDRLHQLSS